MNIIISYLVIDIEHFFIIFHSSSKTNSKQDTRTILFKIVSQNIFALSKIHHVFVFLERAYGSRVSYEKLFAGEDSTNLQLDTTKQERKGGVRWPRGYTLEVNQLIGGNFRGKSGNLTLSCVCSAESRRETPPPPRLPTVETKIPLAWVRGRERNKEEEEEEEEGCGWWGWIEESGGGGRTTIAVDIRASFGGRRRRKTAGVVAVDDDSSGANELRPGKNNKSGNLVSESPVELS